jgi:hypothetical protein
MDDASRKELCNCTETISCERCLVEGKPSRTASMTVSKEAVRGASANTTEVLASWFNEQL